MKTQYFPAIALVLVTLLTGCASQPDNVSAPDSNTPALTAQERQAIRALLERYPQHKETLDAWQSRRGDVERLLALEEELKVLITQLNALAESSDSIGDSSPSDEVADSEPTTVSDDRVVAQATEEAEPEATKPAINTAEPREQQRLAGQYGVQLAAMAAQQTLKNLWRELNSQAPAVFSGQTPRYQQVTVNGNTIYRLKTGLFAERAGADEMCRQIRFLKRVCIVTQYAGTELPLAL